MYCTHWYMNYSVVKKEGNLTAEARRAQSKENLSRQERKDFNFEIRTSKFEFLVALSGFARDIRVLVAATVVENEFGNVTAEAGVSVVNLLEEPSL